MTQISPTALEMVARAVFAARGWPLAIHPAFEHEQEDWEACATAAITAYLAQREKEGFVEVPREPSEAMIEAGCDSNPTQWNEGTDLGFAADVANDVYRAMLTATSQEQNDASNR